MDADFPLSPDASYTVREAHTWASRFLDAKGVIYPERNAEWMLRHLLKWSSLDWLTKWNEPLPGPVQAVFIDWVKRRGQREPLQYILGEAEFYGRTFQVNTAVLIPRPETECLVERALQLFQEIPEHGGRPLRVVDIGVGSGAIAITMALELTARMSRKNIPFEIHGIDISASALHVATANAQRLGAQITFHQGDGLQPMIEKGMAVDMIVSNPPYIPDMDIQTLQTEVRNFEPHLALKGGMDGMDPYRHIIGQCEWFGSAKDLPSAVLFEVGAGQAERVADMLRQDPLCMRTEIHQDLAGINRIVVGIRKSSTCR
ncbi:peptide chain release factor N(5)-glutamine methyltransferase [Fodinisporobacter ferrooxydans]|uniref:Release factor glutamine methyltransferase n=1 Tax=Fodinisporobacter ferrooxydans TaxID=2901836 RepID=A0ABY4CM75_9BACL|nr:peptide chain release factor N(5)-glutamine methyltransferase [Alicyclobacillaceae bacterium MYW30-H2]